MVLQPKKPSHIPNAMKKNTMKMKNPMSMDKTRKLFYPVNICLPTEAKKKM